ncbi:MAG: Rrf2 family transcriptional regulator [Phycisphaeraceae bacterium]|nr:Rrf2 family transcriptional regulator [Phycisphaeraceae bacterium]
MFSQTTEYALRAMAWLALSPGQLVSTTALAQATKVPEHYLAKVLQQLAAAGLVRGRRGVGGGYQLSRPASQITMTEVVRSTGRIERITVCPLGLSSHGTNLCPLHRMLDSVAKDALAMLDGKTLADLIDQPGMSTPLCDERVRPVTLSLSANGA